MRFNHRTKKKLAIFGEEGSFQLMIDLLRLFDTELNGLSTTSELKDEYYLYYVNLLKFRYTKEISETGEEPEVKQTDLEELIKEIKKENGEQKENDNRTN